MDAGNFCFYFDKYCVIASLLQEPKTDKDETYCRKVNEYLNNPPTPGSQGGRGGGNLGSYYIILVNLWSESHSFIHDFSK